jgi:hypothetical protein
MTTGVAFGLLALAHIWRLAVEGWGPLSNPFFILTTLVATGLALWSLRLLRRAA